MSTEKSAELRRELAALIGAMRRKVDPATVEVAEAFARAVQADREGKVLYDRDNAREAVQLFLKTKQNDARFRLALAAKLKQPQEP